jgi:hypothetical protein
MARPSGSLGKLALYAVALVVLWDFFSGGSASIWLTDNVLEYTHGISNFSDDPVRAVEKKIPPPLAAGLRTEQPSPANSTEQPQVREVIPQGAVIRPGDRTPDFTSPQPPEVAPPATPRRQNLMSAKALRVAGAEAGISPAILFLIAERHFNFDGEDLDLT